MLHTTGPQTAFLGINLLFLLRFIEVFLSALHLNLLARRNVHHCFGAFSQR